MKTRIASLMALTTAMTLPVLYAAPASALAVDRLTVTVDCNVGEGYEDDHNIASGDVLTINLLNCSGDIIQDLDDTTNVTMAGNVTVDSSGSQSIPSDDIDIVVDGAADIEIDGALDIDVNLAAYAGDPTSELLATKKLTMRLGAPDMMLREEMIGDPVADDGNGDIYMGGNTACQVEPGNHVYSTLDITVTEEGTYDFRAINVTPMDEDMYWGVPKFPSSDPFFVLYDDFNPNSPEDGIVGCNDDGDNTGTTEIDDYWSSSPDSIETGTGFIMDDQWPWFRTELEPGKYTLAFIPYSTIGTADYNAGVFATSSGNFGQTWSPRAQSVTYEMWGPEGGIVVGEPLAPTGGIDPTIALWSGLGVAGVGVAMTVARRRQQRG